MKVSQAPQSIAIIDYGMGNLRSVESAVLHLGARSEIVSEPEELEKFDKLILPGVGAFRAAVENLHQRGLWDALLGLLEKKQTPLLGICLGMQLLAERGFEGEETPGLGLISGDVLPLESSDPTCKIPHIGFDTITIRDSAREASARSLFTGFAETLDVYFVHSFHFRCSDPNTVTATAKYGTDFVAAVQKGNIYGTQFHPEKSQNNGLAILKNFIELPKIQT